MLDIRKGDILYAKNPMRKTDVVEVIDCFESKITGKELFYVKSCNFEDEGFIGYEEVLGKVRMK